MGTTSQPAYEPITDALDYVQVRRCRDGKQVWLSLILDRLLMLEQLGLVADAGDRP